ncbi:hypothetical protein [Leeuwenhoekiella sp. NPDC079379]|uniref:hypothetical protein n=1 Tax=Leeuwenhoekiella sp. NPDC079379 TaxID=3364122 RepID=UPI0037C747E6
MKSFNENNIHTFFEEFDKYGAYKNFICDFDIHNEYQIPVIFNHSNLISQSYLTLTETPLNIKIESTLIKIHNIYSLNSRRVISNIIDPQGKELAQPFNVYINDIPFLSGFMYSLIKIFRHLYFYDPSETSNYYRKWLEYIEEYGKGFFYGFENFEKEVILEVSNIFKSDSYKSKIIFDIATIDWGFIRVPISDPETDEPIDPYETGIHFGKLYYAWSIMFQHHSVFKDLAEDYLKLRENVRVRQGSGTPHLKKMKVDCQFDVSDLIKEKNHFTVPEIALYYYYSPHVLSKSNLQKDARDLLRKNNLDPESDHLYNTWTSFCNEKSKRLPLQSVRSAKSKIKSMKNARVLLLANNYSVEKIDEDIDLIESFLEKELN